jgi:hypothetical protein
MKTSKSKTCDFTSICIRSLFKIFGSAWPCVDFKKAPLQIRGLPAMRVPKKYKNEKVYNCESFQAQLFIANCYALVVLLS